MAEDKNRTKSLNDPQEILIEDMGDSDSSSTPLIATKSVCKDPDLKAILKMEKLPKSENTYSNSDQVREEDNGDRNQPQDTSQIKTDETKKIVCSSDNGGLFEKIPYLKRTASTPVSKRDYHHTTLDTPLSPIREYKTIKSYEKGGMIFCYELLKHFEP